MQFFKSKLIKLGFPILLLTFALGTSGFSQDRASKDFVLYAIGETHSLAALDIVASEVGSNTYNSGSHLKIVITPAKSNALGIFTANLVSKRIGIILIGQVGSDDTLVQNSMKGPILHIGGTDSLQFQQFIAQYENAKKTPTESQKALITSFERLGKLAFSPADIQSCQFNSDIAEIQITQSLADKLFNTSAPATNNNWLLAVDESVIAYWQQISFNRSGLLKIKGLKPTAASLHLSGMCQPN